MTDLKWNSPGSSHCSISSTASQMIQSTTFWISQALQELCLTIILSYLCSHVISVFHHIIISETYVIFATKIGAVTFWMKSFFQLDMWMTHQSWNIFTVNENIYILVNSTQRNHYQKHKLFVWVFSEISWGKLRTHQTRNSRIAADNKITRILPN